MLIMMMNMMIYDDNDCVGYDDYDDDTDDDYDEYGDNKRMLRGW